MRLITLSILFCAATTLYAGNQNELVYSQPSKTWMGSLPLGNGRLGVMVYGGTATETLALNEVTMWSGQPDLEANKICGRENLDKMRQLMFEGNLPKANELGQQHLNGHCRSFGTHLPFGDLKIDFKANRSMVADYSRVLDMQKGIATVNYRQGEVEYTNEYFCSNPSQIFVARFSATGKGNRSARISLDMLRYGNVKAEGSSLIAQGDARFDKGGPGGVKYTAIVRVVADGGKVTAGNGELTVENANSFTVYTDIRTDFKQPSFAEICEKNVSDAISKGYKKLKKAHIADFRELYDRMDINLGGTLVEGETTDEMFRKAKNGEKNPVFDALFFKYGRYMLISSSREGAPLPANLQGIWNDNLACNMPWTCDYHLDVNIQQNYWSANIANLAECNEPLFRYMELLADYGSETAKHMYGCRGWVAHTINNVWGATLPGNGLGWSMNVTGGAWMATHLWTHYDFTRDKEYLRTVGYPLLKRTAEFFVDYMVADPKTGWLLTGPSISPENAFIWTDGNGYSLSMMPTMDRAVVYDIYKACIEASKVLGIDADFRARLERDIKLLPPYQIGKDGGLQEWLMDVERQDPAHRHASHLLGLYPFGEISPLRTPALAKACAVFLDKQTGQKNYEDTEWTRGNMINFYARLKDGDEAYKSIVGLYTGFMRENLMTVSPAGIAGAEEDIFSFDATEAAVSGVCEMILQSYDGFLDFLPALPKEWSSGSIKGICARGGIEADIEWHNNKVVKAVLRSDCTQKVECRLNGKTINVTLKAGKKTNIKI